jgi:SAM-dependent methyltransferase
VSPKDPAVKDLAGKGVAVKGLAVKTYPFDKRLPFDKYKLYSLAVQSPDADVEFFDQTYREIRGRSPKVLREDFCGTFLICCEWVKLGPKRRAFGVDLGEEPIHYGLAHHLPKLSQAQQQRVKILQRNVLSPGLPKADMIVAVNFSYFVFKTQDLLRSYFKNVKKSLRPGGVFLIDVFGGSLCQGPSLDRLPKKGFIYYWEQEDFDPVSYEARFHIHFKVPGHKVARKVFSYDWRLWTIPELRDHLKTVGFKNTAVYWEGTNSRGGGNGVFTRTDQGESCDSWIAYIAAWD